MDMNGFIGKRFTLISKSDIRYVGTLHQINPEDSTIALENVVSHGTEGRRGNPADEIQPTNNVYEYIVFRGSDVKDISIAEEEERPAPLSVPDDPAILGSARPVAPPVATQPSVSTPQQPTTDAPLPVPPSATRPLVPPGWPQQPAYPGYYPPYNQRFGPPGFGPVPNMSGPYSAPGWYPPDGFGGASQFPLAHSQPPAGMTMGQPRPPFPHGPLADPQAMPNTQPSPAVPPLAPVSQPGAEKQAPAQQSPATPKGPPSATTVAPSVAAPAPATTQVAALGQAPASLPASSVSDNARATANAMHEASRAASAAVAAAMAKLPPQPGAKPRTNASVEALAKKVAEMDTNDINERNGQRGGPHRGGRGRGAAAGRNHPAARKVEVPDADFDFASANAKFNKRDLAKEAGIGATQDADTTTVNAGETLQKDSTAPAQAGAPSIVPYNKSSFFDNISSESRDREEGTGARHGREWHGEEQRRNFETFGQGSVDSGYRNHRGRRGRGRGFNRGYGGGRGRAGVRGGRQEGSAFGFAGVAPAS